MARFTKNNKQRKSKKMRKTQRRRNNRKMRGGCGPSGSCSVMQTGGDCGCGMKLDKSFTGGRCPCQDALNNTQKTMTGGNNPYFNLNTTPYYNLNKYNLDPNDPSTVQNARLLKGGRKKSNKKSRKSRRKMMKGGAGLGYTDFFLGPNTNSVLSFGTTSGAGFNANLAMGKDTVNPAPYVQPIGSFGQHNRILV